MSKAKHTRSSFRFSLFRGIIILVFPLFLIPLSRFDHWLDSQANYWPESTSHEDYLRTDDYRSEFRERVSQLDTDALANKYFCEPEQVARTWRELTPDSVVCIGDLRIRQDQHIPDGLQCVTGSLSIESTDHIETLPDDLTHIGGDAFLSNSNIRHLPSSLRFVGGHLDLIHSPAFSLVKNLTIGGDLDVYDTYIDTLPTNVYFRMCNIDDTQQQLREVLEERNLPYKVIKCDRYRPNLSDML